MILLKSWRKIIKMKSISIHWQINQWTKENQKMSEYQRINFNEHECERNQIIWEEKLKNQFISKMKSFQFIHFYFISIYFYHFLFKTSLMRKWNEQNQISSHFLNYHNQIKMKYSIPMKLFKKFHFQWKGYFWWFLSSKNLEFDSFLLFTVFR